MYFTIPSDNRLSKEEHKKRLGVESVVIDYGNDPKGPRHRLHALLELGSKGDSIVVDSISQLGKTARDALIAWGDMNAKGIALISLKEGFDTFNSADSKIASLLSSLLAMDRTFIKERRKEGIEEGKRRGNYKGKPPIKIDQEKWGEMMRLWESGDITAIEAMRRLGLKRNTFYRRVETYGHKPGKKEGRYQRKPRGGKKGE